MILDFERVSISTQPVTVGGRIEDGDKRDDVWVVDGDELVGFLVFSQVLEFVDDDVHSATSRFLVHFVVESGCQIEGVFPRGLTVCRCGFVGVLEVLPQAFHVVFDVRGVALGGVRLSQSPNLRQSCSDLG